MKTWYQIGKIQLGPYWIEIIWDLSSVFIGWRYVRPIHQFCLVPTISIIWWKGNHD